MKFLLTGFEPFGDSIVNPSEQVAQTLEYQGDAGIEIVTAILPVDRCQAPAALEQALAQHQPDAVLCLGEAGRSAVIAVERLAVNLLDFRIPDNAGNQVVDEPIIPGGPAAYFVTLPARQVMQAIRDAGVPADLSMTAGTYLCNQVLYYLLHTLALTGRQIPAGFLHLPALPEQAAGLQAAGLQAAGLQAAGLQIAGTPTMALETSLRGVSAAIEAVAKFAGAGS